MPWNGSGVFNRTNGVFTGTTVWDDSRVAGRTVRSDDHDTHDEDIATGLENTVTRDGQNQPSGNLPMGGFRHTNVDDAVARNEYASAAQIQDSSLTHIVPASVGGTGDAITLTPTPAITAYAAGQMWSFVAEATNTGATTINVSSLGTRAVQKLGAALVAGDITTGDLVVVRDDGTQFQMLTATRTPVLTNGSVPLSALADGTDGELVTWDASGVIATVAVGTSGQVLTSNGAGAAPTMQDLDVGLPRSYLAGLGLSLGTDQVNDIDIAVGECRDDANTADLAVASAIGKQIDVTWAAGGTPGTPTGGLSSSLTLTNDTTYHVILGLVSGTAEVGFDTSITGANLATDHSFTNTRRIGSVLRGTATNIAFTQRGDHFLLSDQDESYSNIDPGTSAVTAGILVPTGIQVEAIVVAQLNDGSSGSGNALIVTSFDANDQAASVNGVGHVKLLASAASITSRASTQMVVRSNTSAQIRARVSSSAGDVRIIINTDGWYDRRGKDD